MFSIVKYICLFFATEIMLCTSTSPVSNNSGGGGTETTNALVLFTEGLNVYGKAPEGTVIYIYNESYNPLLDDMYSDSIMVGSNKTFRFSSVGNKGVYNIFAINRIFNSGLLIPFINLKSEKTDSIHIPFDTLGIITGVVLIDENTGNAAVKPLKGVYVYCEGTGNFSKTDSCGIFMIENIPVGTYHVKMFNHPASGQGSGEKTAVTSNKQPVTRVEFIIKP